MKTFASKEKRSSPAVQKALQHTHHPMGHIQLEQQAEIHRILRDTGAQAKLTIGQPNDKYEQEADSVADQVMRMNDDEVQRQPEIEDEESTIQTKPLADQITPFVQRQEDITEEQDEEQVQTKSNGSEMLQRKCSKCEEEKVQKQAADDEDEELQTKSENNEASPVTNGFESKINQLKGGGQPLDSAARSFFEPRFGHDFSHVRIHTNNDSANIARSINARAFTLGSDVVMGAGQYQPGSQQGKQLLGHELTHVIQQGGNIRTKPRASRLVQAERSDNQVVQRDIIDDLRRRAEEAVKQQLRDLANKPVGPGGWSGAGSGCPANFCKPFADRSRAIADLAWAGPLILAGIATKVRPEVVPLWASYLSGGSGVQNLSGDFGTDFTNSPTTLDTTRFLITELTSLITRDHASLMAGASPVTLDVSTHLIDARRAINTSNNTNEMNFSDPADIAGNIAGGIGADQAAHLFGARPSPINDSRAATISVTLTRNVDGTITVVPSIRYRVSDTIDLCPGNCGNADEQVATVPLSRFEATSLAGDVPFNIDFTAPATELVPFTVTPAAAPVSVPVFGNTTASALRYRDGPNTSAAIQGLYPRGTHVELLCQTTGTVVLGDDTWYMTSDGFISGRYVSVIGSGALPSC